jgi:hypothetical protein
MSCMFCDGEQTGMEQLRQCSFSCRELSDKWNFCLIGELNNHLLNLANNFHSFTQIK